MALPLIVYKKQLAGPTCSVRALAAFSAVFITETLAGENCSHKPRQYDRITSQLTEHIVLYSRR